MNKGRILISTNGNGHSAVATWWFVGVVGAVIFATVFAWMANLGGLPMGIGVIGAVFCLILSGVTHSRITSTSVNVCEYIVDGVSVTPKFPLSFILWCSFSSLRLSEFQLPYDQISSVDVENENVIIINTANTQHKIYAMNAREIQKAIISRKKDIADSNKNKKVDEVKITSETKSYKTTQERLKPVLGQNNLPPMTEAVRVWFEVFGDAGTGLNSLFSDRGSSDFHVLMMSAIAAGQTEVINWLFSARPDMENNINKIKDEKGESLLHTAAHTGKPEIMKLILQRGADINARDKGGRTIMFVLAFHGHTEAMKWLVNELGMNVDTTDHSDWTPLCKAAQVGNITSIACLVSLGADVRAGSKMGVSPIDCAVMSGQVESIKCLHNLDKNLVNLNDSGLTPIFRAAYVGQVECIECLVRLGANIEAKGPQGETPMFKAAEAGQVESIACLKRLGANVNAALDNGMTPILIATIGDKPAVIECLASLGANVNVSSFQGGVTPIFVALDKNNIESVKCLVNNGANLNIKLQDMTLLDLAIKVGRTEIAEYLRNNGAKLTTEL
jgi:ankyrin repeat protein